MLRAPRDAVPALAALCGHAFHDNPLFVAVLPDSAERERVLPRLFGVALHHGVHAGEVVCSSPDLDDVAVWLPPGALRPTPWQALRAGGVQLVASVAPRVLDALRRTDDAVHAVHHRLAPADHAYLSLIAVDPGRQGRGRCAALLAHGLAEIDRRAVPTYLETAVPGLDSRFARAGFVEAARFEAGPCRVAHVAMLRPAAPRAAVTR